ncbi:MAG: DNA polymerase III subunit delta' [Alphaproteobacteria bacterium]|nr:DNA polymerase III subunit delta' [Alphaproteobacteria bacterium]
MDPVPDPRANPDLFGHEGAERILLDAWTSDRLAHGWLISGPRGIGKATLAFRFARFVLAGGARAGQGGLFADAPPSLHLPSGDPVFRRVESGGHADFLLVERGYAEGGKSKRRSEIVVDDVREVGHFLSHTPAEGGWRVVVVDSADEMNRNAANALLKMLEEPPRRALLLLVAHNPAALLPTIRSRCRALPLRPLADRQVRDLLGRYRPDLAPEAVATLIGLAEGSIGRALSLAEQDGGSIYRDMLGLIQGMPTTDISALHAFCDRMLKGDGTAFRTAGDLLNWWLARVIRFGARRESLPELAPGEAALAARLTGAGGLDRWVGAWEENLRLFAGVEAVNLDRKQALLGAFLTIEKLVLARG